MQKKRTDFDNQIGNLVLAVLCGLLIRCAVSLHSHSGEEKPPMYGDFEAQRHWMEITVNTPISEWYENTTDNDLQYWGLDYPPLTAYHSYLNGKIAAFFNESYVQLHLSRGIETKDHKIFMRSTVIVADLLAFFAPVIFYFFIFCKKQRSFTPFSNDYIFLCLLYPGLILIDHGHFQYNCISLGFTVASLAFVFNENILYSAFFFCLALNYKQMSLYHSLPFFVYMLRICFFQKTYTQTFLLLFKIGSVVILTFGIIWSPFLFNYSSLTSVIKRLFPVGRGVFEDKVGNIWLAVNVVYKIKQLWDPAFTIRVCTLTTLIGSLPSLVSLAISPSHRKFLLSLTNVSLAFFLFSYQVHEKSILLVAIPVLLYAPYDFVPSAWFLAISTVSLDHLSIKDNNRLAYSSISIIFYTYIIINNNFPKEKLQQIWRLCIILSAFGAILIFCGFYFVPPPLQYPDFWPLISALYCCAHYILFFIYFNYCQWKSESKRLISSKSAKAPPRRGKPSSRSSSTD